MIPAETPVLPVNDYRDAIIDALKHKQVVIVAGETGSGKSVMLPRYLREVLQECNGRIAVTEPRRIAAISLAGYSARLDGTSPGTSVGYVVRYRRKISSRGRICYMTDGILMAELIRNPMLKGYAAVMIDEVHERSINIDYLLGYMRLLLPRRPDLKLVLASATINTRFFSRIFNSPPVFHVATRRYPVEIRYQPVVQLWKGTGIDSFIEGVIVTTEQLCASGEPGDILAFLPTVDDVDETVRRLRGRVREPGIRVLALHGRLTFRQQEEAFGHCRGRKVIIATNIAETSITVPGIRIVIDSGLVRMLRYAPEASLNRMPVEKVAQSSAQQRAGRCGRTSDGICIRLYSEQDFLSRPRFTTSEIRRSNLAGLILRMHLQKIIAPDKFPFPDRPLPRMLQEGYRQLRELGAVDRQRVLTRPGYAMAHFPLEPPVACMLLQARKYGVVREVLVIAAALSANDPLATIEGGTPSALREFRHRDSDFMTLLSLWKKLQDGKGVSYREVHIFSERYSLQHTRLREWIDVFEHIQRIYEDFHGALPGFSGETSYDKIHKCLLSGLIGCVAKVNSDGTYTGIRTDAIRIATVSVTAKKRFPWLLFHELVETDRVYGTHAAAIEPKWVEELFGKECTYRHEDPWYDSARGEVMVREEVAYGGLVLIKNRMRSCRLVNREMACRVFIAEALVTEAVGVRYRFVRHNRGVRNRIAAAEKKLRRTFYAGDEVLEAFYADVLGDVASRKELNSFLRDDENAKSLLVTDEDLCVAPLPDDIDDYPDSVTILTYRLAVEWCHSPGEMDDGAVISVPPDCAAALPCWYWQWAVPALSRQRLELLVLRLAPQLLARNVDPADALDIMAAAMVPEGPWVDICRKTLVQKFDIPATEESYAGFSAPAWLWPAVRIVDAKGIVIGFFRSSERFTRKENILFTGCLPAYVDSCTMPDTTGEKGGVLQPVPVSVPGQIVPVVLWYALDVSSKGPSIKAYTDPGSAETAHAAALVTMCEHACAEELSWEIEKVQVPGILSEKVSVRFGCEDVERLAEGLLMKRVLALPGSLPVLPDEISVLVSEVKDRVAGSAALAVKLLELLVNSFQQQDMVIERKDARHKDSGSSRIVALFREELRGYGECINTEAVSYEFVERLPLYLEASAQRIDAALLDPRSFRTLTEKLSEYALLVEECSRVRDYCIGQQREMLRVAVEEFKLDMVKKNIPPRQALLLMHDIEKARYSLERMYREFQRL